MQIWSPGTNSPNMEIKEVFVRSGSDGEGVELAGSQGTTR